MKQFVFVLIFFAAAFLLVSGSVYSAEARPFQQTADEGQALFEQKCQGCHTIGGGNLVGPDLAGVTQRRDAAWLKSFIADPGQVIASGDATAAQLLAEYNNVQMPNMGLTEAQVTALMAYLETTAGQPAPAADSGSQPAPAAGSAAQPAPAGPVLLGGDPVIGANLFSGEAGLANGGTPCISCHSVGGAGALEGGSLGPDLTHVFQRYGEAGLVNALNTIAFPTMQGAFGTRPLLRDEQAHLVEYFKGTNQQAQASSPTLTWIFLGLGTAGALVLFAIMVVFWPKQRQSISVKLRKQQ